MSIQTSAQEILDTCMAIDEEIEINIHANEITIYWENIRFDIQPKDLMKALKVIKDAKTLGIRFE